MCLILAVYLSLRKISEYGPGRTGRFFVCCQFCSTSVHLVFLLPQFCQVVSNLEGTLILPWSRTNFPCQSRQMLPFTGINLTENVKWGKLILLFSLYNRAARYSWPSNSLVFSSVYVITKFKICWRQNLLTLLAGPNKSCQPSAHNT